MEKKNNGYTKTPKKQQLKRQRTLAWNDLLLNYNIHNSRPQ